MKVIRLMLWLSLIGVTMMTITVLSCTTKATSSDVQSEDSLNVEDAAWESASFFPYYIISMHEQKNSLGEECYWLIYDDIDSGFDNEVVSMDEETYHIIHDMWKTSIKCNHCCANKYNAELLKMMEDYEPIIYNNNGTAVILLSDKD